MLAPCVAASGSRGRRGVGGRRGGDAGSLLWALMERRAAGLGAREPDAVQ